MRKRLRAMTEPGTSRRILIWATQLAVFAVSGLLAFLLRFDLRLPSECLPYLTFAVEVWIVAKTVVFRAMKLDRGLWEHVHIADMVRLALGNVIASSLSWAVIVLLGPKGFPRSIFVLDLLICFMGAASVRLGVRLLR